MNVKFLGQGKRMPGGQGDRMSPGVWLALPQPCPSRHLIEAAMGQTGVLLVLGPHIGGREAVAFAINILPKAQRRHLGRWKGYFSNERLTGPTHNHCSNLGLYTSQLGAIGGCTVWG